MKKAISIILCVTMVLSISSIVPFSAFAEEVTDSTSFNEQSLLDSEDLSPTEDNLDGGNISESYGDFQYKIISEANKTAEITRYNEDGSQYVTIPEKFGDYTVTSIGPRSFWSTSYLLGVTIPETVTNIGGYAFTNSQVDNLVIPSSVKTIGERAFGSCNNLKKITIKSGEIGVCAFFRCNILSDVSLGDGVTSIGGNAFDGCIGLSNITIPDSVTNIGDNAFSNCHADFMVYGVKYSTAHTYATINNIPFLGFSVNDTEKTASLTSFVSLPTSVSIPGSFANYTVTSIGDSTFYNCKSVNNITLPIQLQV